MYGINPLDADLFEPPFDIDKRLFAGRQTYLLNEGILFR